MKIDLQKEEYKYWIVKLSFIFDKRDIADRLYTSSRNIENEDEAKELYEFYKRQFPSAKIELVEIKQIHYF